MSTDPDRIHISHGDLHRAPPAPPSSPQPPAPNTDRDLRCRRFRLEEGSDPLTCPYAQVPLRPGVLVSKCNQCDLIHLEQSWIENGGCTTYGCQNSPREAPASGASRPGQPFTSMSQPMPVVTPADVDLTPVSLVGPIIQIVVGTMCAWLPVITGIVSLVYAFKANENIAARQYVTAQSCRSTSQTWCNVGWGVCVVIVGIFFVAIAAGA